MRPQLVELSHELHRRGKYVDSEIGGGLRGDMAGLATSGLVLTSDNEIPYSPCCKSGEQSTVIACVIPTSKQLALIRFLPFPVSGLIVILAALIRIYLCHLYFTLPRYLTLP